MVLQAFLAPAAVIGCSGFRLASPRLPMVLRYWTRYRQSLITPLKNCRLKTTAGVTGLCAITVPTLITWQAGIIRGAVSSRSPWSTSEELCGSIHYTGKPSWACRYYLQTVYWVWDSAAG